jgi:hypothetical protein
MMIDIFRVFAVILVVAFCLTMTAHTMAGRPITWRMLASLPFIALGLAVTPTGGLVFGLLEYLKL